MAVKEGWRGRLFEDFVRLFEGFLRDERSLREGDASS